MMRLRILDGEKLEITVRDKGRGIADLQQAMLPMYTTGGEERSGMTVDDLVARFKAGTGKALDNDRMLLSH